MNPPSHRVSQIESRLTWPPSLESGKVDGMKSEKKQQKAIDGRNGRKEDPSNLIYMKYHEQQIHFQRRQNPIPKLSPVL